MHLQVKDYTKQIGKVTILDDINLEFMAGKIYGLRGKNGSGKTMLMRAICGLIYPTNGSVIINDETLGKDISFPRSVGALIENPGFIASYSGFENLKMLAQIQGKISVSDIEKLMSSLGLDPNNNQKFKTYSLGMKQKLGIVAAVMENPDLIILDEPINALDEESVKIVKAILLTHKERGALIIISCHDKEELEFLSDEIFSIHDGKITGHETVAKDELYG